MVSGLGFSGLVSARFNETAELQGQLARVIQVLCHMNACQRSKGRAQPHVGHPAGSHFSL